MKNNIIIKIFSVVLALTLGIFCFAACGKKSGVDTETGTDTTSESGKKGETDAVSNVAYESKLVEGGQLTLTGEVRDGKLYATVNVTGNPGMAAFNLNVAFDKSVLAPVGIIDSDIVNYDNITSNLQQDEATIATLDSASAFYYGAENVTGDGVLFAIEFNIADGATGDTELDLIAVDGGIVDQNLNEVEYTINGKATVNLG